MFDFVKYLKNNRLTQTDKLSDRAKKFINEDYNPEIPDSDQKIGSSDKTSNRVGGVQSKLAMLKKKKDELVQKFTSGMIDIHQYKQMIGNIPQQIKSLQADLDRDTMEIGDDEDGMNEGAEEFTDFMLQSRKHGARATDVQSFISNMEELGYKLDHIISQEETHSDNPIFDFSWMIGLPKFKGINGPMKDGKTAIYADQEATDAYANESQLNEIGVEEESDLGQSVMKQAKLKEGLSADKLVPDTEYTYTGGAEYKEVDYVGTRRDNTDIEIDYSRGKGYIFKLHEKGIYFELGPIVVQKFIQPVDTDYLDGNDGLKEIEVEEESELGQSVMKLATLNDQIEKLSVELKKLERDHSELEKPIYSILEDLNTLHDDVDKSIKVGNQLIVSFKTKPTQVTNYKYKEAFMLLESKVNGAIRALVNEVKEANKSVSSRKGTVSVTKLNEVGIDVGKFDAIANSFSDKVDSIHNIISKLTGNVA